MPYHWQKTPKLNHLQRNMPFQLRIRDFLISKGVEKPYAWLRKVGISHGVAHRLLNNKQDRIRVNQIGKICEAGYCTPNDLFEWHPSSPTIDVANHPLQKLKGRPAVGNLKQKIEKLSADKLAEAHEYLRALAERPEVDETDEPKDED